MFMEGGLKMERIPTVFQTCSKTPNVPKGKRGKDSTLPTGKTPQQELKKKKKILKVFDRLQVVGVTTSYQTANRHYRGYWETLLQCCCGRSQKWPAIQDYWG